MTFKTILTYKRTLTCAAISSCLLISAAFATQQNDTNSGYSITLMKNCNVVANYPMNTAQIEAYQDLQAEEKKMTSLELPIQSFEQELKEYTEQIEKLTALAIQESEDSLYIDKNYLKQQEIVVAKLDALMDEHQHEFDALGEQGNAIGEVADKFTDTIDASFDNIDYNQMRIDYPGKTDSNYQCETDISNI
ncbi:hypothetical protein RGQ13_14645 [Thalassotalea psychrophila]|uniref:Uncharacterized protein n=1 Tax=Thalassotalea psychrophila TaxID=3065647 RepID=A0ABY9TRB8_9GAMM|nr:hypothetical protein RGQ13_14645 [Colwelliaceae bacterium SQ149]